MYFSKEAVEILIDKISAMPEEKEAKLTKLFKEEDDQTSILLKKEAGMKGREIEMYKEALEKISVLENKFDREVILESEKIDEKDENRRAKELLKKLDNF